MLYVTRCICTCILPCLILHCIHVYCSDLFSLTVCLTTTFPLSVCLSLICLSLLFVSLSLMAVLCIRVGVRECCSLMMSMWDATGVLAHSKCSISPPLYFEEELTRCDFWIVFYTTTYTCSYFVA